MENKIKISDETVFDKHFESDLFTYFPERVHSTVKKLIPEFRDGLVDKTVDIASFIDAVYERTVYELEYDIEFLKTAQKFAAVGMADKGTTLFQSLSYGEQRLVLIARAMVKSPLLLVLDEPTQGLDEANRERILGFMSAIEARQHSTLLFVSHREDEFLPLFQQHIHLTLNL